MSHNTDFKNFFDYCSLNEYVFYSEWRQREPTLSLAAMWSRGSIKKLQLQQRAERVASLRTPEAIAESDAIAAEALLTKFNNVPVRDSSDYEDVFDIAAVECARQDERIAAEKAAVAARAVIAADPRFFHKQMTAEDAAWYAQKQSEWGRSTNPILLNIYKAK